MKPLRLLLFVLSSLTNLFAKDATICLNMIVKDESAVIAHCLESVKPLIDSWVIVDTGSTDGTETIIQECLKDVPGKLYKSEWVNFAHNRNEALELAKNQADYLLIIDADEILVLDSDFSLPSLDLDFYQITMRQLQAADAVRITLIKSALNWRWEGILHETLLCEQATRSEHLNGILNICNSSEVKSGRSKDPNKYLKDAQILEKALEKDPDNARNTYYLAQSYLAAEENLLAEKYFQKRVGMLGEEQELFAALCRLGYLQAKNRPELALETLFRAYALRPTRAEPLKAIGTIYRKTGNPFLGYLVSQHALTLPYPTGDACIEYMVYDHQALIEFANCALLTGRWAEGLKASEQLLENPNLPKEHRSSIEANIRLAQSNLKNKKTEENF